MDEVRQSVLLSMELEETRVRAQEELKIRDQEIAQLKQLLTRVIKERDEAHEKCQKVFYQKLLLQHSAPHSGVSSLEDDPRRGIDSYNAFSSSDCDESVVSPPPPPPPQEPVPILEEADLPIALNRPLPEKGKLLQAVMKAGPLLQTLLLAGPLPQWRHPPPPLDSYQIPPPPVVIPAAVPAHQDSLINNNKCGRIMSRKRGAGEGSDSSNELLKYQRVVLQ
ncbi:UNVERIFIED_CONTAM: hypothetical protein Scaly_0363200 [Sesamum calycinum]|uniref:Uncharacterized protein n=1 Tax=Sesamum calycinum TaxID=2727403 RepID=A0AAW2SEF2_9LAMI